MIEAAPLVRSLSRLRRVSTPTDHTAGQTSSGASPLPASRSRMLGPAMTSTAPLAISAHAEAR